MTRPVLVPARDREAVLALLGAAIPGRVHATSWKAAVARVERRLARYGSLHPASAESLVFALAEAAPSRLASKEERLRFEVEREQLVRWAEEVLEELAPQAAEWDRVRRVPAKVAA